MPNEAELLMRLQKLLDKNPEDPWHVDIVKAPLGSAPYNVGVWRLNSDTTYSFFHDSVPEALAALLESEEVRDG